jgi:HD-GYP domain-containing protein (c-di-GMP phosphodiesterase class II)
MMLQQEMDKELDKLLAQESPPAVSTHSLIEEALEVAADGLKELSQLNEKDPEKTAEVLGGIKNMTESVVSKCFDDRVFLESMLTVAKKDFNTFQHSVRVAMYAMVYSTHQGFVLLDLQPLVLAAMLHDIGVVFLPEKTVQSTGEFSKGDYEQMRRHPRLGYEVLRDSFDDPRIARVCLEHHERLDGSGYPVGHSELHEWSQLVGIIEIFDGMVGWRPHRDAPGPTEAIKALVQMADNGEVSRSIVNAFCTSLVGKMIG